MSGPPSQQLETRHKRYHSNAISFALNPKGLKSASKWALWIGTNSFKIIEFKLVYLN